MQTFLRGAVILMALFTMSCSLSTGFFYRTQVTTDLTAEPWLYTIERNPMRWTLGADRYFFTGEPNRTFIANERAPYRAGIGVLNIDVPNFTHLIVSGNFQTQIFGSEITNSVMLFGPHADISEIAVAIIDKNTVAIYQKGPAPNIHHVIVRVGVNNLLTLRQNGPGIIEGRQLKSDGMTITSDSAGDIYLSGPVSVRKIVQTGTGNITVIGAYSSWLGIQSLGPGTINLSGEMDLRWIQHLGSGDINIIGANTSSLSIDACGVGRIGITGIANLKEITAKDNVEVDLYGVNSNCLFISAKNLARIGLAGYARRLYADLSDSTMLSARYLFTQDVYVRTRTLAHANFRAANKAFASSTNDSSIYFFGSEKTLDANYYGNSAIVTIENHDQQPYFKRRYVDITDVRHPARRPRAPVDDKDSSDRKAKNVVPVKSLLTTHEEPKTRKTQNVRAVERIIWPRMPSKSSHLN